MNWVAGCEDYRKRERRQILEREPTRETEEAFRQELKWLLRSARQLHALVTDPDFPVPQYAEEIAWRVRQLDDSWKSLNNPVTEAEAEAFIQKHFADEASTGAPA